MSAECSIRMTYHSGDMSARDSWVEFTIFHAPLAKVSEIANSIYRHNRIKFYRGNDSNWPTTEGSRNLSFRERWTLGRRRAHRNLLFFERDYFVFEPIGNDRVTVIEHPHDVALARGISALLPEIYCVTICSNLVTTKVESHVVYVQRAGTEIRRVCASVGYLENRWSWEISGLPQDWEDMDAYSARFPRQRLNRERLFMYAQRNGFDPYPYLNSGAMKRRIRLRA